MIFAQPTIKCLWFSIEYALAGGGGPGTEAGFQRLPALGHGVPVEVRSCGLVFYVWIRVFVAWSIIF